LSTEEARTRLLKGEGFSHLLTWMLHVPATFFIFFLIYQKTILLLTQHDINEKTNMKISKNPLMQVIYIFSCKGALVIALCFWKEKTKKIHQLKVKKT
jgi:fumarate reductase subunit C